MRDKIELLVEESGVLPQEAELALGLSGYDVEQALKILHSRMKDVFVVKAKFLSAHPAMYGLALIIANVSGAAANPSFRLRCVFSGNPHLYETDLTVHWYEFEKAIYRARLSEWCHVGVSQNLEQQWENHITSQPERLLSLKESMALGRQEGVSFWLEELVRSNHAWRVPPRFSFKTDLLSLRDFRQSPSAQSLGSSPAYGVSRKAQHSGDIFLNLRIALESAPMSRAVGVSMAGRFLPMAVGDLQAGDLVSAFILESRDSGLYLAGVFGGFVDNGLYPIEVPVESVWQEGGLVGVRVRFGHSVVGEATFPADLRVATLRRHGVKPSFWRRLWGWG